MNGDARLRELILYIAEKCANDPGFGKTELNKILYFADFASFARRGQPITGAEYMRQPAGPVPRRMLPVLNEMQAKGEIVVQRVPVGKYTQERVVPAIRPDLSMFSAEEIALVDEMIRMWRNRTAKRVSDLTHGRAWKAAESSGTSIPYEAVFVSDDPLGHYEIARTQELNQRYHWE